MTDLSDSFARAFQSNNFNFKDADTLDLLVQLAEELGIDPEDAATHYDTYASLKDFPFDISNGHIMGFKDFMNKKLTSNKENTKVKPAFAGKSPVMLSRSWEDLPEKMDYPTPKRQATEAMKSAYKAASIGKGLVTPPLMNTPAMTKKTLSMTPPNTTTKFSSRTNKGQVVVSLQNASTQPNTPLGEKTATSSSEALAAKRQSACPLQLVGETMDAAGGIHLHMMDTVEIKVHAIEERMMDFVDAFKQWMPEQAADIDRTSVSGVTQELVWVVGRIVSDSEGALNDASVLLEGSRMASDGARVRLDLSRLQAFRLFPGQIVAVQGLNPTGKCFVAHQLHGHLPTTEPSAALAQPLSSSSAEAAAPLSIVAAAGPYTSTDDVLFQPLEELLAFCTEKQPDALLLMGPFVNSDHPFIRDGTLDCTFDELFQEQVMAKISAWQQQHPGSRVALMPAVKDAHAAPVFPQPPLSLSALQGGSAAAQNTPAGKAAGSGRGASSGPDGVSSLQNPVSFTLGGQQAGVLISACTTDVIKHLSGREISRNPSGSVAPDRMAAMASHMVGQRSFYPLYPPQDGTCMDCSQTGQLQMRQTPSLLLLPSDLMPFAKVLPAASRPQQCTGDATASSSTEQNAATICINPGRLTKGGSGGTFAHIIVQAGPEHGLKAENVKVDILRI